MTMEQIKIILLIVVIDIIILVISEILMKKYLTRKIIFPRTKLIKGSEGNDELDINNSIFLHMTDGIIAFDRNGKVIIINPAAQKLLNILPEHNNFEDIFGKLNLNVNLEKIIYGKE